MKSLLTYYNFILITILTIWGFFSPTNNFQVIGSILLYPLFVYFALQVFPKRRKSIVIQETVEPEPETQTLIKEIKSDGKEVITIEKIEEPAQKNFLDGDRRMFLKLIGSAGISLFLFSIFTKRFETNFLGGGGKAGPDSVSLKDKNGKAINPAEKNPTDGYRITELDDSNTTYYGFTKDNGAWFIMREDAVGSFRYSKGDANFSASWSRRNTINFDYFENVF